MWHEMPRRGGKRHWSWPLTSMVSFGVQDVPLMLICCCSHSITMETEAQRLVLQVLDRAGFQPSGLLSPLSLFTWLTATLLGVRVSGRPPAKGVFPEATVHHFWFPNSIKVGGKVRAGDPGDPPSKMTAGSFMDYTVGLTGAQIKCPRATCITLAYSNFASLKKKMPWKSILRFRHTRLKIAQSASKCV